MESLSLEISDHFAWGYLKIYPIHVDGVELTNDLSRNFLQRLVSHMKTCKEDVLLIDSFTVFTISASQDDIFKFFAECKGMCDNGKTILITLHQYAFDEDTLIRIRSIADGHIKLRLEQVGDKYVNMMEVSKIRGARKRRATSSASRSTPATASRSSRSHRHRYKHGTIANRQT